MRDVSLQVDPACAGLGDETGKHDDIGARVQVALWFEAPLGPDLVHNRGPLLDPLAATEDAGSVRIERGNPNFEVRRGVVGKRGLHVTPGEELVKPLDDLHVLLRHRPRSISRRLEMCAFHAKRHYGGGTLASMRIRRATPDDAADVARLLHDFNTEYDAFTPGVEVLTQNARDMIANGDMVVLLAGDGPDGLAELRFRKSVWTAQLDCYLEELYVVPALRGQGIGRAMLREAMDVARVAGAAHIELGTSEDDEAARALYESEGFTNREGNPDGPVMLFYEREL